MDSAPEPAARDDERSLIIEREPREATPAAPARIDALGPADVVVSVGGCGSADDVRRAAMVAHEAAGQFSPALRTLLVCPIEAGDVDLPADCSVALLPYSLPPVSLLPFSSADARTLFAPLARVAAGAGARAIAAIGTRADGLAPGTIRALVGPVLAAAADLVLPRYPRHRFDGLLNSAVVYPLTRALYGRRADGQLGVDFAFSPRMLERLSARGAPGADRPLWLLTEAVAHAMRPAEAHVAAWDPPGESPADVGTALVQVLGPLFTDMDLHAALWQRIRGSQAVPLSGAPSASPDDHRTVDVRHMVESFRLGVTSLHEIWSRVMPPATLVAVRRLTSAPLDRFRMPDALWARIVYDFALGHRLRTLNRDHLLRAMMPLYLAWIASFVLEVGEDDRVAVGARLEHQCAAFEAEKPYLVARWRWPDRFNP